MYHFIYAISLRTSISCCLEAFKSSRDFLKPKIEKVCLKAAIFWACEAFNKFNFFQGTNRDSGTDQWRYSPIPEIIRWMGTSSWRKDFWERLDKSYLWLVNGCLEYHRPIITKLGVLLLVFWVEFLFLFLQLHVTDEKKINIKHWLLV